MYSVQKTKKIDAYCSIVFPGSKNNEPMQFVASIYWYV